MKATRRPQAAKTSNPSEPAPKGARKTSSIPAAKSPQSASSGAIPSSPSKRSQPGRPKRTSQDAEISAVASPERLTFALNLRRSRRWLEVSQEEMALRAGMSRSYVSGVELGERNISVDNMARLASVLDLALHQLLDPGFVPGSALHPKP